MTFAVEVVTLCMIMFSIETVFSRIQRGLGFLALSHHPQGKKTSFLKFLLKTTAIMGSAQCICLEVHETVISKK
jgi:hypothetical protein